MKTQLPPTQTYLLQLIVVLFLSINTAVGQNGWIPGIYKGVPASDKTNVFFDEFENNDNHWNLNSDHLKMDIKDGDFYCESRNDRTYVKKRFVRLNRNADYEIEIRMRYVKGTGRRPIGLTFGRDKEGNEFNFYYSADGNYRILKYQNSKYYNYVNWRPTAFLSGAHSFQTLTVRKVGNRWYYFINQTEVFRSKAENLFGSDVGFTIGGMMAIEVDYLRVSELKNNDKQGPVISISQPILDINNRVSLTSSRQTISGRAIDPSGIASLTINGYVVPTNSKGDFSAALKLPKGKTTIVVAATDKRKNKSQKTFFVEYFPERPMATHTPVRPGKTPGKTTTQTGSSKSKTSFSKPGYKGNTYLLTIGINKYKYWGNLHNAIKDSRDIAKTLIAEYQFDEEHTIRLFDDEATRENILETLESLQDVITKDDNLLIYYAGHGYYDSDSKRGYWVPTNARQSKIPDYIRNSTIHDYLNSINTRHTLLVVDACYAGSLFSRSRNVVNEANPSRWAFTSGDIEKVWDGQPGENSPFAKYLIQYLKHNKKDKFRADELINLVKSVVSRNTDQTPLGSPLQNVGDEGGVFIFYRK